MVKVVCSLCGKSWEKEGECKGISHGMCEQCERIYNDYIDGNLTFKETLELARKIQN